VKPLRLLVELTLLLLLLLAALLSYLSITDPLPH
jgi:hypothetical protein